jgi:hypothetical protein
MINKEYGSDFSIVVNELLLVDPNKSKNVFCSADYALFFSGRVALYNLIESGIKNYKWQKLCFPSFYCHEVVDFVKDLPIEIAYYEYNPFLDPSYKSFEFDDNSTTVIVNVVFFGIKSLDLSVLKNSITIDDLTHHLEGVYESGADYCFGSLRKELPVPCGGFLMSPKKKKLPEGIYSKKAEEVSIQKLTAMFLKKEYLLGKSVDKELYRKIFLEVEHLFENSCTSAKMPITSTAILKQLNIEVILQKKTDNIKNALTLLNVKKGVRYNFNQKANSVFGLIIECPNAEMQSKFKNYLIQSKIFPAVLWPNQNLPRDIEVSERTLFVHLDYRYDYHDIKSISTIINKFSVDE